MPKAVFLLCPKWIPVHGADVIWERWGGLLSKPRTIGTSNFNLKLSLYKDKTKGRWKPQKLKQAVSSSMHVGCGDTMYRVLILVPQHSPIPDLQQDRESVEWDQTELHEPWGGGGENCWIQVTPFKPPQMNKGINHWVSRQDFWVGWRERGSRTELGAFDQG